MEITESKSKVKTEGDYTYINPYKNFKNENFKDTDKEDKRLIVPEFFFDKLEIDSVYIHSRKIEVKSHKDRPIYKVINKKDPKKYVIRKLRGKNIIDGNQICFDTITANELGLKGVADIVVLKKISNYEKYTTYLWRHSNEDIRIAYRMFLLGMLIGIASLIVSIMSLK